MTEVCGFEWQEGFRPISGSNVQGHSLQLQENDGPCERKRFTIQRWQVPFGNKLGTLHSVVSGGNGKGMQPRRCSKDRFGRKKANGDKLLGSRVGDVEEEREVLSLSGNNN